MKLETRNFKGKIRSSPSVCSTYSCGNRSSHISHFLISHHEHRFRGRVWRSISTTNVQTVRCSYMYYRQTDSIESSLWSFSFLVSLPIRNHNINSYPFTPPLWNFIYHAFTRIRISLGCRPWRLIPWTRRLIPYNATSQVTSPNFQPVTSLSLLSKVFHNPRNNYVSPDDEHFPKL